MKVNFKHGIVYRHKNILLPKANNLRLEATRGASLICTFLRNNKSTLVWLDGIQPIEWKLTNKSNKIFLEFDGTNVLPLTVEVDGTDYFKSGSKLPKNAPNGSTFYNIADSTLYLMLGGRWQARSVIHLGTVTGNRIVLAPIGTQMGAFSTEASGITIQSQDAVPLPGVTSSDLFEMAVPDYIICNEEYEIISVAENTNKIQRFDAVSYDGKEINRASLSRQANGIILEESDGMCLICHAGIVSNILLNLSTGKVFYDDFGTLTNKTNKSGYHEIGFYDAENLQLIISIKHKETII